jgi:hypothetical protein
MYLGQVSLLLLGQQGWDISSGIDAGGKPIQRQPLLEQYKQQANRILSINKYTPLVIRVNNKNKQLTLLSQRKLALTARNTLLCYKIIGAHKKILRNGPALY